VASGKLKKSQAQRIRKDGKPHVVDLFSGCGGISLGFSLAGYQALAGMDTNRPSMRTWWLNHRPDLELHRSETPSINLAEDEVEDAFGRIGLKDVMDQVDILVGGPPCQAYSKVGRNKINNLAKKKNAHLGDERGQLWISFLDYAEALNPAPPAILIENVPESLNYGGVNIPEQICDRLQSDYSCHYTILNAAEYGVPQMRERVFIVAIHKNAGVEDFVFPEPVHRRLEEKGIQVAGRNRMRRIIGGADSMYAVMPPDSERCLPPPVTTREALGDLPYISALEDPNFEFVQDREDYSCAPFSDYQKLMRNWKGFEGEEGFLSGNEIRHTPRDFPIFHKMEEGDDYRKAFEIAEQRLFFELEKHRADPSVILDGITIEKKLRKELVPPYDHTKFFSKWTKLRSGRPSHTVVAHLQADTYSHIHYDSEQARGISVREAARLQSFPDGFEFPIESTIGDKFAQIGNAVPPLLAYHLALSIAKALGSPIKPYLSDLFNTD
jgi:DNA (cytosine-5)-methyltransferase 1